MRAFEPFPSQCSLGSLVCSVCLEHSLGLRIKSSLAQYQLFLTAPLTPSVLFTLQGKGV